MRVNRNLHVNLFREKKGKTVRIKRFYIRGKERMIPLLTRSRGQGSIREAAPSPYGGKKGQNSSCIFKMKIKEKGGRKREEISTSFGRGEGKGRL